jgi:hypothetical protein
VADHIAALKSPEEQLAIATKLFGDAGADMIAVFRQGSPVFKDAATELRAMGGLISNEDIARAGQFQQVLDDLSVVMQGPAGARLPRGGAADRRVHPDGGREPAQAGEGWRPMSVKWLSDNLVTLAEIAATATGVIAGGLIGSALGPLGTVIGALIGGYAGMKTAVDLLEGSQRTHNEVTGPGPAADHRPDHGQRRAEEGAGGRADGTWWRWPRPSCSGPMPRWRRSRPSFRTVAVTQAGGCRRRRRRPGCAVPGLNRSDRCSIGGTSCAKGLLLLRAESGQYERWWPDHGDPVAHRRADHRHGTGQRRRAGWRPDHPDADRRQHEPARPADASRLPWAATMAPRKRATRSATR